jgi:hypothetical protein
MMEEQMKSIRTLTPNNVSPPSLGAAQSEPIVIRRENRDVAVILSSQEYNRLRSTLHLTCPATKTSIQVRLA